MFEKGLLKPYVASVRRAVGICLCASAMAMLAAAPAGADNEPDENGITAPSIATSLPGNGDLGGIRKALAPHGITYNLVYTNDVLANLRGGLRRGTIVQGKLDANLQIDFGKLAGWQGLSFYVNALQIHNTGRIRRDYVGGMNTVASIEALPTTRLYELWLEQKFLNGVASIRFGQLAADGEFVVSGLSGMFLQSGWPTITAVNLPSGGPAEPLPTPAVRLKLDPTESVSLLLAVFNGDPAGPGVGDEQERNRHGLNFRVRDPAFIIGEAQWRTNQGKDDTGLARTVKLGGWTHLGSFNDQRFANDGTLLANPLGSGAPLAHRGNHGIYGVIDQQLYRPTGVGPDGGVSVFGRVLFSPSDRNLVDAQIDGGIVFAGMIPGRPDDRFGASVIYARFSDSVRAFDRDTVAVTGIPGPIRDYETNLELTYVAQVIPGWTMQPVLTRIWHPNGDASRNATVFGARSVWRY